MSDIRVTYSGLISFSVGLISVITGLIFTIVVTRQLTQEEFGTWGLIGGLLTYVLILHPIISYWTTREIARDDNSAKTSLLANSVFSIIAVVVYLGIILVVSPDTVDPNLLFLAAILIPVEFGKFVLMSISSGHKPQIAEYGILVFETTKIPIGLVLIYFLEWGLTGVILTSFLSSIGGISILLIQNFQIIRKGKISGHYIKKWSKLFWIPTYPEISGMVRNSDVVIFTIITGSVGGIAYWTAARAVSLITKHSEKISRAVYPKLLSGGKKEHLEKNLIIMLYFAFPLSAMSIIFSRPALFALNPIYEIAAPVVIILVPFIFLRVLGGFFTSSLSGKEKVDIKKKSTFIDYLKSKLFFLPTLENIHQGIYLVIFIIFLFSILDYNLPELDIVMYWAMIALIARIPFTAYYYILVRREFSPRFNQKIILKYMTSCIVVFGTVYFLMDMTLEYKISIFEFMPEFLPFVVLSVLGYMGLTYLVDNNTKKLFKNVLKEIKIMSKGDKS